MAFAASPESLASTGRTLQDCYRGSRLPVPPTTLSATSLRYASRLELRRNRCSSRRAVETNRDAQTEVGDEDWNQWIREGQEEAPLVERQASKQDNEQDSIADRLERWDTSAIADVAVVGCGPAGLSLAGELGKRGVKVVLVGENSCFVNNYGVWLDEFQDMGIEDTLECVWKDAVCFFGEGQEVRVGRGYGRVSKRLLRRHLLDACARERVLFHEGLVDSIAAKNTEQTSLLHCGDGSEVHAKLVSLASGAAAGRFLKYEEDVPSLAAQTAYGIEAEVEGYGNGYDPELMLFMDYRRHHTGLWDSTAQVIEAGKHPNAGDGLWGTSKEVPSFLYAMPLPDGTVFLEETCLVAKPALPFAVLKRRLERRMAAMGIRVKSLIDEEWSYIPIGGPLPVRNQPVTAFGAAANLIHPATGYSISRSLREAPTMADAIVKAVRTLNLVGERSKSVWDALWPQEKRKRASFHIFGMELLTQLDLNSMNEFFKTFFKLPRPYWQGFLASTLSAEDLLVFAIIMFLIAPINIKVKLVQHLVIDPSGGYLVRTYMSIDGEPDVAAATITAIATLKWCTSNNFLTSS